MKYHKMCRLHCLTDYVNSVGNPASSCTRKFEVNLQLHILPYKRKGEKYKKET